MREIESQKQINNNNAITQANFDTWQPSVADEKPIKLIDTNNQELLKN